MTSIILGAWQLACMLAVKLSGEILLERAQEKTKWGKCTQCGKRLHSKGFKERKITSLIGVISWKRRIGRCPERCKIGQVAPLDQELGIETHQQTSHEMKRAACLMAIFGNTAKVTISLTKGVLRAYCDLNIKQGAADENPEWIIPDNPDYLQMRVEPLSAMRAEIS